MMTLYGIANCDTVKKARADLAAQGQPVMFHDYKKNGVTETLIRHWLTQVSLATLLNKNSATYRQLAAAELSAIATPEGAIASMIKHPTLIKRPILECAGQIIVGYQANLYQALPSDE